MKKVMLIKPALETDAVFDPIRTCSYLGLWYLASLLKQLGHQVLYLDEAVRDGGLNKQSLVGRILNGNEIREESLSTSFGDFRREVMNDFRALSPADFVEKHSAFKSECVIRTIAKTGHQPEETLCKIAEFNPDVVGIPLIATANYLPATKLARAVREAYPKIRIVFGGQHVSASPEEFLGENPCVNTVITGDAIGCIADIVEGRVQERVVRGEFQAMSNFPLLDPEILRATNYPTNPTYTFPTSGRTPVDFMFSKGCYKKCDFCVAGCQTGNCITAIDYGKIDEQLSIFAENSSIEIIVQDDAFLWDKNHALAHLSKILKLMKKYGIFWQNNGGVEFELLDSSVTDLLVSYNKNGEGRVTALYVPFNPRSWNKGQSACKTMSQRYHPNLENLKRLRDSGIYVFASIIVGTPEETESVFWEDLETARTLITEGYLDAALGLSATMLPGTRWYAENGHNIVNKKDYPGFSLFVPHHRTPFLTPQDNERLLVTWLKELDGVQKTFPWGTPFFNSVYGA